MSTVDEGSTNAIASRSRAPLKFFLLVFALSVPFWLLGAATDVQLLPGLPMSALALFCPVMAAAILLYRENGTAGVIELLKRAFDYQRISAKVWYAAHPSSDAWRHGVVLWTDARDGNATPAPAIASSRGRGVVPWFFLAGAG